MPKKALSDFIYVYYIKDDKLHYDRSVSRTGLGPGRATELVAKHKLNGHESFYTIGTLVRADTFS